MTIRTIRDLRDALDEFPDYWPITVEQIVGGDLVTEDAELEALEEYGYSAGTIVRIKPSPDQFGTLELIDEGLKARAAAEQRTDTRALRTTYAYRPPA